MTDFDINEIKDPRAISQRTLKMPDGEMRDVAMTNWHWRVYDETHSVFGYSLRRLHKKVIATDQGEGFDTVLMGMLEALVDLDIERHAATNQKI